MTPTENDNRDATSLIVKRLNLKKKMSCVAQPVRLRLRQKVGHRVILILCHPPCPRGAVCWHRPV